MAVFDVVFEGGGAKGSAFAGAITATLRAAGYSPAEMLAAVNEKVNGKPRFAGFMDRPTGASFTAAQKANSSTMVALREVHIPLIADEAALTLLLDSPLFPQLFSFVECGGFFAGDNFLAWLTEKLAAKGLAATGTLATFFAKTQSDLSVVTSDTTDMEMLVLNHRTAPDVPVAWAVRMSMSIPFVWREVVWQDAWGTYQGRRKTGNIFVDGGVLSNFPIRLIAEPAPDIMGDIDPNGALNLGLLLDETLPIPGTNPALPPEPLEQLRVVQRISRLMDTMMGAQDNEEIRQCASEICRLPVKGYGTTEFNMSDARLQALVDGGSNAVKAHLRGRGLSGAAAAG